LLCDRDYTVSLSTLREDYLKPPNVAPNALDLAIRMPASRIGEIVATVRP
jgi:hypothetical protein